MPPRARSPNPKSSLQQHYPAADSATFKDLLLFEERLKRNAGLLKKRKRRYQLYLILLVSAVVILSSDVLLETELFTLPINTALYYYHVYREKQHAKTSASRVARYDQPFPRFVVTPYVETCLLFVLGMTLFLFFASGMYSEKVGYANKYVPHANKALRSFNMYLNVRTQPLPSHLSRMAASLGLSFLFPAPTQAPSTAPSSPTTAVHPMHQRLRTRSLSSSFSSSSRDSGASAYATEIIPPIPPSSNPRGELIFSSRVHANFREQYERYRENYERKRASGSLGTSTSANAPASGGMRGSWLLERLRYPFGRADSMLSNYDTPSRTPPPPDGPDDGTGTPGLGGTGSPGSLRGRKTTLSTEGTPLGSRRSSPAPGGSMRKGSKRVRSGKISRQGTPLLEIAEGLGRVNLNEDRSFAGTSDDTGTRPDFPAEEGTLVDVSQFGNQGDVPSMMLRRSGETGSVLGRRRGRGQRRGSLGVNGGLE